MKKTLIFICLISAILSCKSDDENIDGSIDEQQPENGFTFEDKFYSTSFAYFQDDNTIDDEPQEIAIILGNVDLLNTNQESGVNFIYIEVFQENLEIGTLSSLNEYEIYYNTSINDRNINRDIGDNVLKEDVDGLMAESIVVNIKEFSDSKLNFDFSFNREDGKKITGAYNGPYTDLNME